MFVQKKPKDFDTPVEFRLNFSALDAGDTNTSTLDYLSLDRISPVLDEMQTTRAANQVCIGLRVCCIVRTGFVHCEIL